MADAMPTISAERFNESEIIYGNNKIQTIDVKCLRIKDIYQKLLKEGDYDIGGTYTGDAADYWFFFSTEIFGDNFMMHLIVGNRHESSFILKVSCNSEITHLPTKKNTPITYSHLPLSMKSYNFKSAPDNAYNFVTTFSFTMSDLEELRNRELLIFLDILRVTPHTIDDSIFHEVKMNYSLGTLLKDPICSDFTIETADGSRFAVHRAVLAAQSQVFKAMLKEDTAESQSNSVRLDHSKETMECLLKFMYTGTVDDIFSHDCRSLLMLADQYDVPGLSTLAQSALRQQLNGDNVLEMAVLGDMLNSDFLKNVAFKYVKEHPEVLHSESWKQFHDQRMIKQIFGFIHRVKDAP